MFLKKQKKWVMTRDKHSCQLPTCGRKGVKVREILTKKKAEELGWSIDAPFNSPFNAITICFEGLDFLEGIIEKEVIYFLKLIKVKTLDFLRRKPYPVQSKEFYKAKNIFFNIEHP